MQVTDPVTNSDIYGALMGIREDIGGLKATAGLQLEAIKNHSGRLVVLEDGAARQKGAAKVWTIVGTGVGSALGAVVAIGTAWLKHRT